MVWPCRSETGSSRDAAILRANSTITSAIFSTTKDVVLVSTTAEFRSLSRSKVVGWSANWVIEFGILLFETFSRHQFLHLYLYCELQGSVEPYRHMNLSISRPLLCSIFYIREAWLTKFFLIIKNCIHIHFFIDLQYLKESLISLGIAVLEDCILKESIDDKYCQLW